MTDTSLVTTTGTEVSSGEAAWLDLGFSAPPTQDELPYDDGIPMETYRHRLQMELLINPLAAWLGDRDAFVGGNMFMYFSLEQVKHKDYLGPDVFVVLDVPRGERKSWVTWHEGKAPDIVIELLSISTAAIDKGRKKEIYQNQLRATEYFWFNPFNADDLAGFILIGGTYEPIAFTVEGQLISQKLNLALVRWSGSFNGTEATWLRWATLDGILLPNDQEIAAQERQRAERAELELERLRQQMQARGINLED